MPHVQDPHPALPASGDAVIRLARRTTLIIPTYNNPDYLSLCLHSILAQSVSPAQIIIADDGSTHETADVVADFERRSQVPVLHVWHEDDGFRKGVILNEAIARATGDYLVVLDGDIMAHPDFIRDHLTIAAPGCFVSGSRMKLSPSRVKRIQARPSPRIALWERLGTPNAYRCTTLMKFVSPRYKQHDSHRTLKGGNMGAWKEDIVAVNGYDEDFRGWGYEDTDLGERLRNRGLKMMNLKWGGIGYHLWHPESSRSGLDSNLSRLQETRASRRTRCLHGMDAHLPGDLSR